MALDRQINLYGIDTNAFLSNREKEIKLQDSQIEVLRDDKKEFEAENIKIRNLIKKYGSILKKIDFTEYDCDYYNSLCFSLEYLNNKLKLNMEIVKLIDKEYRWRKKIEKSKLLLEFLRVVTLNKTRKLYDNEEAIKLRTLDRRYLRYVDKDDIEQLNLKKVIGMFESSLSRSFRVPLVSDSVCPNEDIFVVDIYYYDLAQDIILNGFLHNGEKYIYFSSSAGQIRTKKAVFVKESLFRENEKKLTCGLSLNIINDYGGMNINKYLAYLSLCNSATDLWENVFNRPFDIDKCIVVDDFETNVYCKVDDINYETYKITPDVEQDMPIPHTDGCGMILSSYSSKNFMVRLPWIKGLLGSFDFKRFIELNNCSSTITDIWGSEYDIIKDDIQVIFTKSQLKMYKYYSSWDEYKSNFKKYKCEACICNMEEDKISNARINYQMLQTLYDMTDEEVKSICKHSKDKILKLSDGLSNMIQFYGIYDFGDSELFDEDNEEYVECEDDIIVEKRQESYFQKALKIYPELLNDPASKEDIKALKDSMVKQYKSGKLDVLGKFTFVLPDLYAFCQWLFVNKETGINQSVPTGLLNNKEVYCRLYKTAKELDCLRSPHLYVEHAIRNNVCDKIVNEEPISDWFTTDAIYTSTYDLISRILQFDVDGDRLLVLAQKDIIAVAKRCMENINPLYYEMKKAKSEIVTKQSMYNGLIKAFTGGNIGNISNDITKIWNSNEITEDSKNAVRWLCMETNFTIDFAKTLFKPTRPKDVDVILKKYGKQKVPFFFQYAKNKEPGQCDSINKSIMNRICAEIEDKKISFKEINKLAKPSLDIILSKPVEQLKLDDEMYILYNEFSKSYGNKISGNKFNSNIATIVKDIKKKFNNYGYTDLEMSDMLCFFLYNKPTNRKKNLLWRLYGDIILSNIKKNIDRSTTCCKKCGKRINKSDIIKGKCKTCNNTYKKIGTKIIQCIDCGKNVEVAASDMKTCRCEGCNKIYKREQDRIKKQKKRAKLKVSP